MKYPILMADVIGSGKKNPQALMERFRKTVMEINNKANLISPLTITLGDEFQGIASTITEGIKIIFDIEEIIVREQHDFKLKYVLHFGTIGTPVNPKIAYEMLGEGLTTARENLARLKGENHRFLILLEPGHQELQQLLNKLFLIYGDYVDSWKPKDLAIVAEFLAEDDYKSVAKKVGLDPSSAWRRHKSLKIKEYTVLKEIIFSVCK